MITLTWHFIIFLCIEAVLVVKIMLSASRDTGGFLSGLEAIPWILLAIALFLIYGGVFLW